MCSAAKQTVKAAVQGRASEDARQSGTIRCEAAQAEGEATIPAMGATVDLDGATDLEHAEEPKRDDSTRHIPMYCSKCRLHGWQCSCNAPDGGSLSMVVWLTVRVWLTLCGSLCACGSLCVTAWRTLYGCGSVCVVWLSVCVAHSLWLCGSLYVAAWLTVCDCVAHSLYVWLTVCVAHSL